MRLRMSGWVPKIGEFVKHLNGHYYGQVVGYGERFEEDGRYLTLRVGMTSNLVQSRIIVIEDIADRWRKNRDRHCGAS